MKELVAGTACSGVALPAPWEAVADTAAARIETLAHVNAHGVLHRVPNPPTCSSVPRTGEVVDTPPRTRSRRPSAARPRGRAAAAVPHMAVSGIRKKTDGVPNTPARPSQPPA